MSQLTRRALLAEDCSNTSELYSYKLKCLGLDVTVVPDGAKCVDEALNAQLQGDPYDVILVDIDMPIMDGCTAASMLRKQGYTLPILAITAGPSRHEMQASMHAGCDGFLAKLTIDETLEPTLNSIFNRSEYLRQG